MTARNSLSHLENTKSLFRYYKSLGERAIAQLDDEQIKWHQNENSNSISIIVKHLSGNMLSRWTDFLTTDGEKSWRQRDDEFVNSIENKQELLLAWNKGWDCLFNAIDPLTENDLQKIVYIRDEGHTVMEAINRQLAHYAYHIGQIIFVAKILKGEEWQSLSIPKGKSSEYNKEKLKKKK
ncbi:MAG: hypothetical protein COA57_13305 [Flavobacteriales bacterium]|nr:MAG: hypothetical protein COA57_13305 [Flavobacteriales bacterium]